MRVRRLDDYGPGFVRDMYKLIGKIVDVEPTDDAIFDFEGTGLSSWYWRSKWLERVSEYANEEPC